MPDGALGFARAVHVTSRRWLGFFTLGVVKKLLEKFARLSAGTRFLVLFSLILIICFPAIPMALHSGRRIYPEWSGAKFAAFGILLSAAHAAFVAGCAVFFARCIKRR